MSSSLWNRYTEHLCAPEGLGLRLDVSRMNFSPTYLSEMQPKAEAAFAAMRELEAGAIANPDENRQVGHYWLRDASKAPNGDRRREIKDVLEEVKKLTEEVHEAVVKPETADRFETVLIVGIGGSALGPQFVGQALGTAKDPMAVEFVDNTDPDGVDLVLAKIGEGLKATLTVVISKSGGTKETRNGMLEVQAAYEKAGLQFAKHAVAITGKGSQLDCIANGAEWLRRIAMYDYIGGRTSEFSAVGLLPAALQGIDIDAMLSGAAEMDAATRVENSSKNPAMLMALMWHYATNGKGERDLVLLPYKDRLMLFSKYLQQLIMESLGKEKNLDGNVVNQGLAVYGNKGSTDQHAYVQQLRDGVNNFFVTFIQVLKDRDSDSIDVEPGITTGDYLQGFLMGTRKALHESGRESMTITVPDVSPRTVGMLIALFERTVGFYASLVNINAYHQPGVEAGKKAAGEILALQSKLTTAIASSSSAKTAQEWASEVEAPDSVEEAWMILEHLAANGRLSQSGTDPANATFGK